MAGEGTLPAQERVSGQDQLIRGGERRRLTPRLHRTGDRKAAQILHRRQALVTDDAATTWSAVGPCHGDVKEVVDQSRGDGHTVESKCRGVTEAPSRRHDREVLAAACVEVRCPRLHRHPDTVVRAHQIGPPEALPIDADAPRLPGAEGSGNESAGER